MDKHGVRAAVGVLLALAAAGELHAQIRPSYQFPAEPPQVTGVQVGSSPFYATPYVGLGLGRDDNLFYAPTNEKASSLLLVSPGISVEGRARGSVLVLKYQGQIGRYFDSHDDDYEDHALGAVFDHAFDARNFLRLGLNYLRAHDPRGSTDRPISSEPDKYRSYSPNALYAFGAPGAQGRIEIYGSTSNRRYLNNRAATEASDRDSTEGGAAFYWRIAPKTYALVEGRATKIDYKIPDSPNAGDERKYFGGISWEATAATTGTLKFGQLRRKADLNGLETKATSWEGLVTWSPRTYSTFDFYTSRVTNESTGLGSFILSSIAGVTWGHSWNSYFSTGVLYRYQKDEYQGFDRSDKINSLGLKAAYRFRRWLTLGAEYNHTTRDSSRREFEYDKNLYLLTATASM